jgi:adenine-specific DNA-methyltransferase
VELTYCGKKTPIEILDNTPICNFYGEVSGNNLLIKGENLTILQKLRDAYTNKIDLIYIDPPFSTNTIFTIGETRVSTISMRNEDAIAYIDNLKGYDFIEFIRESLHNPPPAL